MNDLVGVGQRQFRVHTFHGVFRSGSGPEGGSACQPFLHACVQPSCLPRQLTFD
jgi:hypothetical protein